MTAASDPELYRAVARHLAEVRGAARTLGYRLAASGQAFRLVRVPVAGAVTAPPPPPDRPGRRVLALTCVLAAACAEVTGPASLARLSGRVRDLTTGAAATVSPYDPELLAHRGQLAAAAALLEHWGVLRRRPPRPAEPAVEPGQPDDLDELASWTDHRRRDRPAVRRRPGRPGAADQPGRADRGAEPAPGPARALECRPADDAATGLRGRSGPCARWSRRRPCSTPS